MQKTKIAFFPLQIFLLPGEKTNLHIFEPRYKQLLNDCAQNSSSFGIPLVLNKELTGYGSIVRITNELKLHADGSSDIEIEGFEIFKIDKFSPILAEKLYPGGDVDILDTHYTQPVTESFMNQLGEYLKSTSSELIPELLSTKLDVYSAARIIDLTDLEKLKLVKASTSEAKELILLNKLKMFNKIQEQLKSIDGDLFLN